MNITQNGNTVLIEKEGERLELSYIRKNIIHCRYGKEAFSLKEDMLLDERAKKTDDSVGISVAEDRMGAKISGGAAEASVSEDLCITWEKSGGRGILLQEGKKEFVQIPVMKYTTGGEAPVIDRVKTVD
ncbi:MAG: hypothetical protein IIU07_04780, partial [Lachnospiraceae bacterium]|nr:hypothetical protein [Lachnospiraceae bacterium]